MNSFQTIIVQEVVHGSFFTLFYRKIALPFAPNKGIELRLATQRGEWGSELETVLYVHSANIFVCYGTSIKVDRPIQYDAGPDQEWDIHLEKRNIFDRLVADGWVKTPEHFEWTDL